MVLLRLHVDEIDDDETAQITQTQLTGNFVGRFQIRIERGGLDIRPARGACRVDVDRYERLGRVDHDGAARRQVHLVRMRRFDLILDLEAGEQGDRIFVKFQLAKRRRHEALHVLLCFVEHFGAVDQDLSDLIRQVIPQGSDDRLRFLIDQERSGAAFARLRDCAPDFLQIIEIPLQLFR